MTVRGVHVDDLRKAVDPVKAPKLLVLRGQHSFADEDNAAALNQVLRRVKANVADVELNDMALPSYRVLSGVSNDPEDTMFSPEDQFPLVLEALKNADIILVASHQHCGLPSADLVRVIERLMDMTHERRDAGTFEPLFSKKVLAVITNGGFGSYNAALAVAGAFNKFGCTPVSQGIAFWDGYEKGAMLKDRDFSSMLDRMAGFLGDLCVALKR